MRLINSTSNITDVVKESYINKFKNNAEITAVHVFYIKKKRTQHETDCEKENYRRRRKSERARQRNILYQEIESIQIIFSNK